MHRLIRVHHHLLPDSPTFTMQSGPSPPAPPHPISPHLLSGFSSQEHSDERQYQHSIRKREELHTAKRENEWRSVKERAQPIQPPTLQTIFATSPDSQATVTTHNHPIHRRELPTLPPLQAPSLSLPLSR